MYKELKKNEIRKLEIQSTKEFNFLFLLLSLSQNRFKFKF